MVIRPKTKRRLLILLSGVALFSLAAVWLYSYRIAIAQHRLDADKQIGIDAYEKGDYQTAIDKLATYINHEQKHEPDKLEPKALLAYAISRSHIPTKNEDYIVTAVKFLRDYCTMVPDDLKAREQLLEMEAPTSTYTPDALIRAADILRDHPDDVVALKAVAEINFRQHKYFDAQPAVLKYIALVPTDLDLQYINFEIMADLQQPQEKMFQHAQELVAKYPNDPRFKIVKAWAIYFNHNTVVGPEQAEQRQQFHDLIVDAAKADPPSIQFVKITTNLLDSLSEFGVASEFLDRASAKFHDPQLTLQTIVRLWEVRNYTEVLSRLKDLDPSAPDANSNLIAIKALSLYQLNQTKDADALVAALDARGSDDPNASAWAIALKAQFTVPQEDLKTRLAHYQEAQTAAPTNGYIDFLLGDAYAQLDEGELALKSIRESCEYMPSWAEPNVRLSQLLIHQGRGSSDEAARAAENARRAGTNATGTVDLQAAIVNIAVSYDRLAMSQNPNTIKTLLDEVRQIQTQIPSEPQTLPIYVALLAQTGQRDMAIDVVNQACKNPGNGGEDMLMDLVQTSRDAKLGMEPTIYAAIESKYGMTPRLAFSRAIEMLNAGQADAGLKLLTDSQAKSKVATDASYWDRAICQYREAAHSPDAPAAWQALGEKYPKDVAIQSAILTNGNSAWNNHQFISTTIDRLKALTGDSATGWQTAEARLILSDYQKDDHDHADATKAVTILTPITTNSPDEYIPHVLLATAYDRLKNTPAALQEWNKAAALQPQAPQSQFAYLQALHNADRKQEAQIVFDKLAGLTSLPPDMALAAATIMAAEGDMQRAQSMLTAFPSATNQVLHDATLAKVYRVQSNPQAAAIYLNLANAKKLDVNTIREAADFFGAQGQLDEAHKFLDRLAELNLPGGQQQIIQAEFEEEHGSNDAARKLYDQAVEAAGNNPEASIRQIGFLIRQRDWTAAKSAFTRAAAQWPDSMAIANLGRVGSELSGYSKIDELGPMVSAVTTDPLNTASLDTIAIATNPGATLQEIRALLTKYPDFEPAYELNARRLIASGNPGEAVAVARKAMGRFPRSVDAARVTAEVNAASGNWNDAIIAAREWRQRALENPRPADQFIAIADLAVNQPIDAVDRLTPYIKNAQAHADSYQMLLSTYAQALIGAGRQSDAAALLQPLAKDSAKWRAVWLDLTPNSFTATADADAWINQVKPLMATDSIDEQGELASVYAACAQRQNNPQDYTAAMNTLKPFLDSSKMGAEQWLTYAGSAAGLNDMPTAQNAYREVLKLDPQNAIAQNNLADVLARTNNPDSLKEAEEIITKTIANHSSDAQAFNFYDTLARIQLRENHAADAIESFKKGYALNPKSLDILIGLASVCAKNGQTDAAVQYLSQIDTLIPPGTHLTDELQTELSNTRQAVRKSDSRSSVSGTDFSPSGK